MRHLKAQLATEIEACRLLVYNAARMRDNGISFVKEAAMAKYYSSEVRGKEKKYYLFFIVTVLLLCILGCLQGSWSLC